MITLFWQQSEIVAQKDKFQSAKILLLCGIFTITILSELRTQHNQ